MKTNPTRYSSAVGEIWVMAPFKIKYCQNQRLCCQPIIPTDAVAEEKQMGRWILLEFWVMESCIRHKKRK